MAKQPGGVDVPFDTGRSGMSAACGVGAIGMVALVEHHANGPVPLYAPDPHDDGARSFTNLTI